MSRYIINDDGEIIDTINNGDKLLRAKTLDYLRETVEINKDASFIKVYTKSLFEISRVLTGPESMFINYLLNYIQYQTGILGFDNGRTLTRAHMAQETEQELRTIDRLLEGLIKKQILGKHRTGRTVCFLVNPYIFMKGNRVNKTLVKLFENSRWAKVKVNENRE